MPRRKKPTVKINYKQLTKKSILEFLGEKGGGCDKVEIVRQFGLSERKSSYLINLSNYMIDKNSYEFWNSINDEEINNKLLKLKGIGPWSIKMFLIFSLNRKDVFSPEDLGLLKAIGKNYLHL